MNNSHRTSSLQHNAPFDSVAAQYDADFTDTRLGERKRQIVRAYVEKVLQQNWHVLELNCGTGHDALWLAERVQHVLATDVSEGMIAVAREKAHRQEASNITFNQMAIEELWSAKELNRPDPAEQFNFVFSNFDGLNCVQDIALVPKGLHHILKPKGEAIVVLMSKFCMVETVGFALRGKFSAATARFSKDAHTGASSEHRSRNRDENVVPLHKKDFAVFSQAWFSRCCRSWCWPDHPTHIYAGCVQPAPHTLSTPAWVGRCPLATLPF